MANKYPTEVEGNVLMWLGGEMSQAIYTGFLKNNGKWCYSGGHKVQAMGLKAGHTYRRRRYTDSLQRLNGLC